MNKQKATKIGDKIRINGLTRIDTVLSFYGNNGIDYDNLYDCINNNIPNSLIMLKITKGGFVNIDDTVLIN
jgi:hypothetical protein